MVQQLWSKFYWHNEFIYADQQPHIHNAMQTEFMYAALFSILKKVLKPLCVGVGGLSYEPPVTQLGEDSLGHYHLPQQLLN